MLDLFNLPTPQGCDIQTFYGSGETSNARQANSWSKPRGISNVYMLLIGAGGDGNGTTGGGSGGITVWYGSAVNVPDTLNVLVGASVSGTGTYTEIVYRSGATVNTLLRADRATGSTAGTAITEGVFAASGFYQSIAGQAGSGASNSGSSTTFLGGGGATGTNSSPYGYTTTGNGIFNTQPIIFGLGGMNTGKGDIGCGGGSNATTGKGGPGFVLIASW